MPEPKRFDIYLGGPWEDSAPIPYKKQIKAAFPYSDIYDPEEAGQDWFERNMFALNNCTTMVAMVPEFPLPGVGPEVGIFYARWVRLIKGQGEYCFGFPIQNLIIIWPDCIRPAFGKQAVAAFGIQVATFEHAIERLRIFTGTDKDVDTFDDYLKAIDTAFFEPGVLSDGRKQL